MVSLARFLTFLGVISLLPMPPFADEFARNAPVVKSDSKENAINLAVVGGLPAGSVKTDSYDVLLHSRSLTDQRTALDLILREPQQYVPRLQQSLGDYPRLLGTNRMVANRVVYLSALIRDPSFPPILVKSLGSTDVLNDCIYACPVVFALTIQACFADWSPPGNLDSRLSTVYDLKAEIQRMPSMSLKIGSIADEVKGPDTEELRNEFDGKTEEQLIQMAGPMTASKETRILAAFRLETLVSGSKNRIELYLLALNDFEDGSGEYKGAVYQSIYRAEVAKARGQ